MKPAVKMLLTFIVVCAAAAIGMYVGTVGRGMSANNNPVVEPTEYMPNLKMPVDSRFPSVALQNEYEQFLKTDDLLGPHGTVVLFMELGCPPCEKMLGKWQRLIDDGVIDSTQVIGITYNTADYLDVFPERYGLTFPIYSDTARAFMRTFGVDAFPLTVVVRPNGTIAYVNGDARRPVDTGRLRDWLGQ